jgi:hypothetical protein
VINEVRAGGMKDKYKRPRRKPRNKNLKFNQIRLKFNFWFLFLRRYSPYFCQSYATGMNRGGLPETPEKEAGRGCRKARE